MKKLTELSTFLFNGELESFNFQHLSNWPNVVSTMYHVNHLSFMLVRLMFCPLDQMLPTRRKPANGLINLYSMNRAWWLFPLLQGFWRMFYHSFPACAFFSLSFFKVEISSCTLIPLFRPGSVHSSSVSWGDCGQAFPDRLRVNSFLDMTRSHNPKLCLDSRVTLGKMTGVFYVPLR